MLDFMKRKRRTLLLVDDEIGLIQTLKDRLEANDYIVITAENGSDGFKRAISNKPDVIITDILMPIMDGFEMIQNLRSVQSGEKKTPIIISSSIKSKSDVAHANELGVVYYFEKPYEMSELLGAIENALESGNVAVNAI